MRGLQRSPHVTTTMEFPAESTLVSILYLQQPEHRPVDLPTVQSTVHWTVHDPVPPRGGSGRYSAVLHHLGHLGSQLTPDCPVVRSAERSNREYSWEIVWNKYLVILT